MAQLTDDMQRLIVSELAYFRTPSEVADIVKEQFGVVIDRRQVELYNPLRGGRKPAKKWCALFEELRKDFLEKRSAIAITHRSWRQRELLDMVRLAKKQKNYKLAAELLEQAAKEEGDIYMNRHGGAAPTVSDEDRAAAIRAHLDAMDGTTVAPLPPSPVTPTAAPAPTLAVVRSA